MKPISRETIVGAWLSGSEHLRSNRDEDFNVILEVQKPWIRTAAHAEVERLVNAALVSHGRQPLHTVAETIFPASEYRKKRDPEAVYTVYPDEVYPRIESVQRSWGNYAMRLLRREVDGKTSNPLRECVERITSELRGDSPKRARYELSVAEPYLELPITRTGSDYKKIMGAPCLSHISLKIRGKKELLLTALYRSHYYFERALGNLIGLARLQQFVCDQTGLKPGPLVCVSTLAQFDRKGMTVKQAENLLRRCRAHVPIESSEGVE